MYIICSWMKQTYSSEELTWWKYKIPKQASVLQSLLLEISEQVKLVHKPVKIFVEEIKLFISHREFLKRVLPWVWRLCPLSLRFCLCCLLHPPPRILNMKERIDYRWKQRGGKTETCAVRGGQDCRCCFFFALAAASAWVKCLSSSQFSFQLNSKCQSIVEKQLTWKTELDTSKSKVRSLRSTWEHGMIHFQQAGLCSAEPMLSLIAEQCGTHY